MPDSETGFPPLVLTFAASDPSGGAGVQADLLTLASMGCHPVSVITALTIQDSLGVEAVRPMEAEWVADQARCLLEDMPIDAFKIGAMGSVENIAAIAEVLADYPDVPLVLDPLVASGSADEPGNEAMLHALVEMILPQTTILVSNGIEVRRLAETDDEEEADVETHAAALVRAGCEFVLVTGTHDRSRDIVNRLYGKDGAMRSDTWQRLPGSYHGAGGTLAAAIAAMLANGLDLAEAVKEAQDFTWHALARSYRPGMGNRVPDRLFWAREEAAPRTGVEDAEPRRDALGNH